MPRKPAQKRIEEAIVLLDKNRKEWLGRPGVTAVDVGFKISGNKLTSTLALRVHVERKKPLSQLEDYEIFNVSESEVTTKRQPKKAGQFPIDVIEATYVPSNPVIVDPENALAVNEAIDRTGVVTPLIGGISCGNSRVTAGTLACIVFSRTDGVAAHSEQLARARRQLRGGSRRGDLAARSCRWRQLHVSRCPIVEVPAQQGHGRRRCQAHRRPWLRP